MNEMRIYVASLSDYNNGRLEGKWLDLADYSDASELMEAIQEMLDELTEKYKNIDGEVREEFAVHDYEGIPSTLASEYMGEQDFQQLYDIAEVADERGIPVEVLVERAGDTGSDDYQALADSLIMSVNGNDESDIVYEYENQIGELGFDWWSNHVGITITDQRLLYGEDVDNFKEEILAENPDMDESEAEGQAEERADDEQEQRNSDLIGYLQERGYEDEFPNWVYKDYQDAWENDLSYEFDVIHHDGQMYVFSNNYSLGGTILSGMIGAYIGYKVGRAKPQKKGFETEKKIGRKIKGALTKKKMANGGYVSKGEKVWNNMRGSEKYNFLNKNFTPQITPRDQETLSNKSFRFLPKNVKIAFEAEYANKELAKGGGLDVLPDWMREIQSKGETYVVTFIPKGKRLKVLRYTNAKSEKEAIAEVRKNYDGSNFQAELKSEVLKRANSKYGKMAKGGGIDGKMNFYVAEGTIYWSDESGEYQRFYTRNHIKSESKEKAKMIFIRYIENQTRTNEWDWAEDDIFIEPATDSDEVIESRGYLSEKDYGGLSKDKFSVDRFAKGGGVDGKKYYMVFNLSEFKEKPMYNHIATSKQEVLDILLESYESIVGHKMYGNGYTIKDMDESDYNKWGVYINDDYAYVTANPRNFDTSNTISWQQQGRKMEDGGGVSDNQNKRFLDSIDNIYKQRILFNIANHYRITLEEALDEVTDSESENLYEYITDSTLRMEVYKDMKNRRYAEGGRVKYYLNGFEESINYILNSTNGKEVKREGSKENGDLIIYFETTDEQYDFKDKYADGGAISGLDDLIRG